MNKREVDPAILWRRFKEEGCQKAREALIERYAGLARITASRKHSPASGIEYEDLVSETLLALTKAVDQFDPSRGVKFETYAIGLMRGGVLEHMRDWDWMPRSLRTSARALAAAYERLLTRLGRRPNDGEWALEAGLSEEVLAGVLDLLQRGNVTSLEALTKPQGYAQTLDLREVLPNEQDCFEAAQERVLRGVVLRAIAALPQREAKTILLYYYREITYKRIGERLGVSESRAYQLHQQALGRLQKTLEGKI